MDLAAFGAVRENKFIKKLLALYDDMEFDILKTYEYVQPNIIQILIEKEGVKRNGSFQIVDGMVFLPRTYLFPKDCYTQSMTGLSDKSII